MILTGTVLKVETIKGTSGPENRPYQFERVHILDGIEVIPARLGDDYPKTAHPSEGEVIAANVSVRAYKDKNGAPQLGYTLLGLVDQPALTLAPNTERGTRAAG